MPDPIIVTERKRRFTRSYNQARRKIIEAVREFDVSGCGYNDAADAVGSNGLSVPADKSAHPQFDKALLVSKDIQERTPKLHLVSCTYRTDDSNAELLLEPPRIQWSFYEYMELSDFDAEGNAYETTVGFPFGQPMELPRQGVRYSYTRWVTDIDYGQLGMYQGRCNDGPAAFPGFVVADGQARVQGISSSEHTRGVDLVRATWDIDIRETGHQHNVLNLSAVGWCDSSKPKLGLFVSRYGGEPTGEVRVSPNGIPFDSNIYVMPSRESGYTGNPLPPIPPPTQPGSYDLINSKLSTSGKITVLTFIRAKKIAFAGLQL